MWEMGGTEPGGKGAGQGGNPPAPASCSPSGKQWRQKVSMSPTVASTSSLPNPFLLYTLHPRSQEGLANTFNVLCQLLKEGTGRAQAALHPQLSEHCGGQVSRQVHPRKPRGRKESRKRESSAAGTVCNQSGAAARNQPLLCRALWASPVSLGPQLCPQGWEPWA